VSRRSDHHRPSTPPPPGGAKEIAPGAAADRIARPRPA
jgi:hypothetical protein